MSSFTIFGSAGEKELQGHTIILAILHRGPKGPFFLGLRTISLLLSVVTLASKESRSSSNYVALNPQIASMRHLGLSNIVG